MIMACDNYTRPEGVLGGLCTLCGASQPEHAIAPAVCLDCSLPYSEFPLDVILPRAQWLEIHPIEHGLLCAACIMKRAARVPGCTAVHAILEIAPQHQR